MADTPTYEQLQQRIALLEKELEQHHRFEKINSTLFEISNAINTTSSLDELYKTIHLTLSSIIDTTNFYIASYDKVNDLVTFPYIVDRVDINFPPVMEISRTASLTAEVIRTGSPILITKSDILALQYQSGLKNPCCTPSEIWLGVPLTHLGEIVGVMAVQNYDNPLCYDQTDMKVMVAVADQVAIAIEWKQAEKALKESEVRFRKLLQEIPSVSVQGYKLDGTTSFWNRASERLYGYNADEAIGRNLLELIIPPEMKGDVEQAILGMAETGVPIPASELSLMRKDGSSVSIFSSHAIIEIPGREPELFCIDVDLTESKQAEAALKESEAYMRSIFRAAPTGIGVVHDRVFRQVNDKFCEMLGYSRDELIGTQSLFIYPSVDEFEKVGRKKYEQIKTKGTGTVETVMKRKNGELIDVLMSSTPIDVNNLSAGVTFTALNITSRKQAEEALWESEQRYRSLFERSNDAIFLVDTKTGRYLNANAAAEKIAGRPLSELTTLTTHEITPVGAKKRLTRVASTDGSFNLGETIYVRPDGSTRTALLSIVPLNEGLSYGIAHDITERKQAEQDKLILERQLQQAQKMESVGRLAGGVAHDFNNMLGVILGHTELAMEELDRDHPVFNDLQQIFQAANRSTDITKQLLAFARKQIISPKVFDLNETVTGMLNMLLRLIGEDIYLTWLPGKRLWPIKIDPSQIDQILVNLCVNARDAIADVGKITVETKNCKLDEEYCLVHAGSVPGQYVKLDVSDNGCGIDKETVSNIFEPFFTTKGVNEGTGLGLATVYGIVKQNNGFVYVYSEQGQGTTFSIYLPRYMGNTNTEGSDITAEPAKRGNETILLVEDEPTILNMTTTMLQRLGYTVLAVGTPGEAVRLADEHSGEIDLVLTDVIMPEMNGRMLTENLMVNRPGLKCLFMSGYTANVISQHGVLDDGVNFMQKPFAKRELAAKIRKALSDG